jgi:hypothetical protein
MAKTLKQDKALEDPQKGSEGGSLQEEKVSKDEMNLAEYPMTLLSRRAPKGVKTLEYTDWVTIEGNKKPLKWIITGSDKFGLPVGGDQDIYVAIIEVWRECGFKDRVIPIGSIYQMLKRLGLPDDKQYYERFRSALDRLRHMSIIAENAFWDKSNQCYFSRRSFNIFDEYYLVERFRKNERTAPLPFGYIRASEFFYQSVKNGYLKDLDLKFYFSLPTPLTKRLYRFLDKKAYNQPFFSMELFKFSKKIGLMTGSLKKYYPSQLKQTLTPALDELQAKGFLKEYQYQKTADGKGEKAVFFFSQLPKRAAADADGDFRIKGLIEDIVEVTGAEHSRAWYAKAIRLLGPETAGNYVYQALSLTKDASHKGEIKTTRDQFFISTFKRLCKENGISLG